MWRDQLDRSICNQIAIIIYLHIINICVELVLHQHRRSTDLLEKCVWQRRQNDPKDRWRAKIEQFWTQKADCSFKFKWETARTLKIYFEKVSDRGNETIVEMIAIVKQVILASKSRLVFEFKRKTASMQLLHSAATTRCTQCYQTPFSHAFAFWGAGSRD